MKESAVSVIFYIQSTLVKNKKIKKIAEVEEYQKGKKIKFIFLHKGSFCYWP